MLTKTNKNGERISKLDNDIIEIENNLNLEILKEKKLTELKSEKRIDFVIREAPDDLESGTKEYNLDDLEAEEEKNIEALSKKKARSGTEYIQIHEELRESGGYVQAKIPYVRKKTFLKARAHYALQTREEVSQTLSKMINPVKDYKFSLTMDGPSFLPIRSNQL
jgi:hypothetical protein